MSICSDSLGSSRKSKRSDFLELPKMNDFKKVGLPEEYHALWELCCIFRAKIKEHEEAIKLETISNPVALELASEVRKAVTPNEFVNEP